MLEFVLAFMSAALAIGSVGVTVAGVLLRQKVMRDRELTTEQRVLRSMRIAYVSMAICAWLLTLIVVLNVAIAVLHLYT